MPLPLHQRGDEIGEDNSYASHYDESKVPTQQGSSLFFANSLDRDAFEVGFANFQFYLRLIRHNVFSDIRQF